MVMKTAHSASARTLNDFLVPGMLNLSIEKALVMLGELCYSMQESQVLVQRVFNRLIFLRLEVENKPIGTRIQSDLILRYGELVGNVLVFLRKYSTKTLLARIASNRRFLEGLEATHKRLDYFFMKVNLTMRAEMTEWQKHWEADLNIQQLLFESFLSNRLVVNGELNERGLEEALTKMKYELTLAQKSQKQEALMKSVEISFRFHHKMDLLLKPIPTWFVARDEIQYKQEPFAIGTCGAVHRGTLERTKAKVVIKCMYSDSKQTQEALYTEGELWNRLDHPNVLKMKGGCYVGSPVFLLCEDAGDRRSFDVFFSESEKNKQKLWHLFLGVAEGLLYLHTKGIVHNNVKCSNLLVGVDGRAKLCDFGFSYDMNSPLAKKHPAGVRWKAPELLASSETAAVVVPSFASDVYSLGMAIIEAVTGNLPWGQASADHEIIKKATTAAYVRPNGFTDKQWALVKSLCAMKPDDRLTVPAVVKELRELIHASERKPAESTKACSKCTSFNPVKNKFCNECGNRFADDSIPT